MSNQNDSNQSEFGKLVKATESIDSTLGCLAPMFVFFMIAVVGCAIIISASTLDIAKSIDKIHESKKE